MFNLWIVRENSVRPFFGESNLLPFIDGITLFLYDRKACSKWTGRAKGAQGARKRNRKTMIAPELKKSDGNNLQLTRWRFIEISADASRP